MHVKKNKILFLSCHLTVLLFGSAAVNGLADPEAGKQCGYQAPSNGDPTFFDQWVEAYNRYKAMGCLNVKAANLDAARSGSDQGPPPPPSSTETGGPKTFGSDPTLVSCRNGWMRHADTPQICFKLITADLNTYAAAVGICAAQDAVIPKAKTVRRYRQSAPGVTRVWWDMLRSRGDGSARLWVDNMRDYFTNEQIFDGSTNWAYNVDNQVTKRQNRWINDVDTASVLCEKPNPDYEE